MTEQEHAKHLEWVLQKLRENKLYTNPKKCEFGVKRVKFLGHIVSDSGILVDPEKIDAVTNWPVPKTVKDIRSFLGLAGYFRKFVKDFSAIALPLTELTQKDKPFTWTDTEQKSFDAIKLALNNAPVLIVPNQDLPFTLITDASGFAVGAVRVVSRSWSRITACVLYE